MLQSRFSSRCHRQAEILSGTISRGRLTISEAGLIRLSHILPQLTIWSLITQNTDTLSKTSAVSVQAVSEHLQDIIHQTQTAMLVASVRGFYVLTAAVNVWAEIVYRVVEQHGVIYLLRRCDIRLRRVIFRLRRSDIFA